MTDRRPLLVLLAMAAMTKAKVDHSAGCTTILFKLDIADIGIDLRWKANAHGRVKSWSTKPQ